ncbi:nucleotidyl transferase AbiEii/AbiGii toxin family protein [Lentisphaera profundi]|uniref:Nucleotidyl transferase AbiEii/AbiGii toxin family protein n=1 Tax=Lentisphaera profundi TaxID=1658616 RepID=A0ABY7VXU8_9BACT|nr:nucleotidyl transferase AbiEii/AbiGii toxin family protein [Lentisphaera profundi]WDE98942.1 nucleotidyl transferase AbiEii/AbiGii toxin family protein [Lentisphaera profundi]
MKKFIELLKVEQVALIRKASATFNLSALTIEKDFWVTYLLDVVFNRLDLNHDYTFKGGTSLSKCFNLIERFSEDIDLSLNMGDLGFGEGEKNPMADPKPSRAKLDKIRKDLEKAGTDFVRDKLLPGIDSKLKEDDVRAYSLYIGDNGADIYFEYPRVLRDIEYPVNNYVTPRVLIETGTKAMHNPYTITEIDAMCVKGLLDAVKVKVLSPQRTFWEKITILHAENNINDPGRVKDRFSRHIYDIHQIYRSEIGVKAIKNTDLLADVAKHKGRMFIKAAAKYDEACKPTLKVALTDEIRDAMAKDYEKMTDMFYRGEKPSFEELLDTLQQIDDNFNNH